VGADMEGKIGPEIFKEARIFTDDKSQCMRVEEWEIPLSIGIIAEADIAGEIGDVIDKKLDVRRSKNEITIFDTTGIALLDLILQT